MGSVLVLGALARPFRPPIAGALGRYRFRPSLVRAGATPHGLPFADCRGLRLCGCQLLALLAVWRRLRLLRACIQNFQCRRLELFSLSGLLRDLRFTSFPRQSWSTWDIRHRCYVYTDGDDRKWAFHLALARPRLQAKSMRAGAKLEFLRCLVSGVRCPVPVSGVWCPVVSGVRWFLVSG